jgi:heme-degrading monooxygenase HmoA
MIRCRVLTAGEPEDGTYMFLALWEFEVKPGCEDRFQSVYGAEGEWVRLFRSDPSFMETRLLKDPVAAGKFVTVDFWVSREAYESFKELNHAAYVAIDQSCEGLTNAERCLGNFEE